MVKNQEISADQGGNHRLFQLMGKTGILWDKSEIITEHVPDNHSWLVNEMRSLVLKLLVSGHLSTYKQQWQWKLFPSVPFTKGRSWQLLCCVTDPFSHHQLVFIKAGLLSDEGFISSLLYNWRKLSLHLGRTENNLRRHSIVHRQYQRDKVCWVVCLR